MSIIFKDRDKMFELDVLGYEFKNIKGDEDEDIANWIELSINYSSNNNKLSEVSSCLFTYEIEEIIDGIESVLNGLENSVVITFIEPYLVFALIRGDEKYAVQFRYVDNRVGWKILSICEVMNREKILELKNEFKRMYDKFPYRETSCEYKVYKKSR